MLTNNGTVRVLAGAGVPAGNAYSPISASTWSGSGTYQAVGGTWNDSDRQFTASAVQPGTSGMPVSIDLLSEQRILVSDSSTGWSVGVSFLAEPASTPLNFTATTLGGNTLASLDAQLLSGQSVLAAWSFLATSGYESGDPAYLSFDVGSASGLEVWQYNGSNWTQYDPTDLTDDGTYASFTVTSLGDYAVSAVPEPATIAFCSPVPRAWWGSLGGGENATRKAGDPIEGAKPTSRPSSRAIRKFPIFPSRGYPNRGGEHFPTTVPDRLTSGSACV